MAEDLRTIGVEGSSEFIGEEDNDDERRCKIKKEAMPLDRRRMAKREFGGEEGSGAAVRLCEASPEKFGGATSGGAKGSSRRGRKRMAKGEVRA